MLAGFSTACFSGYTSVMSTRFYRLSLIVFLLVKGLVVGCASNNAMDEIINSCDAVREEAGLSSLSDDSLIPVYVPAPKYPKQKIGQASFKIKRTFY